MEPQKPETIMVDNMRLFITESAVERLKSIPSMMRLRSELILMAREDVVELIMDDLHIDLGKDGAWIRHRSEGQSDEG